MIYKSAEATPGSGELDAIYDSCEATLNRQGAGAALAALTAQLDGIRARVNPCEWRALAKARNHALFRRLHQDPYTAQAFKKPRGYAGDAHTLDFVYGHRDAIEASTPEGRDLCHVSTNVPIAAAVRARCALVTAKIQATLRGKADATIVSVACGHMRELHGVDKELLAGARIVGLDQDAESIRALATIHSEKPPEGYVAAVRSVISGRTAIPQSDLIYASGLYDYLPDEIAVRLTAQLSKWLAPGGVLLIPNLTPENDEIGYMEAIMDWWMVYRSVDDMERLIPPSTATAHPLTATSFVVSGGKVACLYIKRIP